MTGLTANERARHEASREARALIDSLTPEVRAMKTRLRATDPEILRAVMARVDSVMGPPRLTDEPGHPLCVIRLLAAEALPSE